MDILFITAICFVVIGCVVSLAYLIICVRLLARIVKEANEDYKEFLWSHDEKS
jgi:hypothetical protein